MPRDALTPGTSGRHVHTCLLYLALHFCFQRQQVLAEDVGYDSRLQADLSAEDLAGVDDNAEDDILDVPYPDDDSQHESLSSLLEQREDDDSDDEIAQHGTGLDEADDDEVDAVDSLRHDDAGLEDEDATHNWTFEELEQNDTHHGHDVWGARLLEVDVDEQSAALLQEEGSAAGTCWKSPWTCYSCHSHHGKYNGQPNPRKKHRRSRGCDAVTIPMGPQGSCTSTGDPHIVTFDRGMGPGGALYWSHYFPTGYYWIVKNRMVQIQAHYAKAHWSPGINYELAIGGLFMRGHRLRIDRHHRCHYDGRRILTSANSRVNLDGIGTARYDYNAIVPAGHGRRGLGFTFELPLGVTIIAEPRHSYMNYIITMRRLPGGQNGHCGNFNGHLGDDLHNWVHWQHMPVPAHESLFPQHNPGRSERAKTLDDCPGDKKQQAYALCRAAIADNSAFGNDWLNMCAYDVCFGNHNFAPGAGATEHLAKRIFGVNTNKPPAQAGEKVEVEMASSHECPPCPTDCLWSAFPHWNSIPCPVTCGRSVKTRVAHKTRWQNPRNRHCHPSWAQQTWVEQQACDQGPCPCEWSGWTNWYPCSVSCGGGRMSRTRHKTVVEPAYGICNLWEGRAQSDLWYPSGPYSQHGQWLWYSHAACNTHCCPQDCRWLTWEPWEACSHSCTDAHEHLCGEQGCGAGRQSRSRGRIPAQCGGAPCVGPAAQDRACNTHPCPIDCQFGPWEAWDQCTYPCGGGHRNFRRGVYNKAMYGGRECVGPNEQEMQCNVHPCPEPCEWVDWSPWTACAATCGGLGRHARTRKMRAKSVEFEQECTPTACQAGPGQGCGTEEETRSCADAPCPVDCVWGEWGDWQGGCSRSCEGGVQARSRERVVVEDNGGNCTGWFREVRQCNTQLCPIDCQWAQWTEWGACSEDCGGGWSYRARKVASPPLYGGFYCLGRSSENRVCNLHDCTSPGGEEPGDCTWADWEPWSTCTATCGPAGRHKRRRLAVQLEKPYNATVNCTGEVLEVSECNAQVRCPQDCIWSEWGAPTPCSASCGGGLFVRTREIERPARYMGQCLGDNVSSAQLCNTQPCPQDCYWAQWAEWQVCSASCNGGVHSRSREFMPPAMYGGRSCPKGPSSQQKECNVHLCPIDCKWYTWESWGVCSLTCGAGTRLRTRMVMQSALRGGKKCHEASEEMGLCNAQGCPVHCEWSQWSAWGNCTSSCGGGFMRRARSIAVEGTNGGTACNLEDGREYESCGVRNCPVDCLRDAWTDWGSCSVTCGGGLKWRYRNTLVAPAYGGRPCTNPRTSSHACNENPCPEHCVWTGWTQWAPNCSVSESLSLQRRFRSVFSEARFGGEECHGGRSQLRSCSNTNIVVDCTYDEWGQWTSCSSTCGTGVMQRARMTLVEAKNGGKNCSGGNYETSSCPVQEPCPVHCQWRDWGQWSSCSATCGGGRQERSRGRIFPEHGGKECEGARFESKECAMHICPISCSWGKWADWMNCAATCGPASRTRSRTVARLAAYGGEPCERTDGGLATEQADCRNAPCPVDCTSGQWSSWTVCSTTCGPGWRNRHRHHSKAEHGGKPCLGLSDMNSTCFLADCPVDGYWLEWSDWTHCSWAGVNGRRQRTRISVAPKSGGHPAQGSRQEATVCEHLDNGTEFACEWSAWSAWRGPCAADSPISCGSGQKTRSRQKLPIPTSNATCDNETDLQEEACELPACPIDCVYMEWEEWSSCSAACAGEERATRQAVAPAHGGLACDESLQWMSRPCNVDAPACLSSDDGELKDALIQQADEEEEFDGEERGRSLKAASLEAAPGGDAFSWRKAAALGLLSCVPFLAYLGCQRIGKTDKSSDSGSRS
eukprot:TRINITY_DN51007_c0_g1_i1.p1 TRINITY_DN51007_c0_g1~~TRINITY_DN51007_c0_g1_i1.p1  ORF type:complete len:1844 (+),score=265.33 TRINITY_DN51007_c0_g1_i1:145-5676(+)